MAKGTPKIRRLAAVGAGREHERVAPHGEPHRHRVDATVRVRDRQHADQPSLGRLAHEASCRISAPRRRRLGVGSCRAASTLRRGRRTEPQTVDSTTGGDRLPVRSSDTASRAMNSRRRPAPTGSRSRPVRGAGVPLIVVLALLIATLTVAGYVFRVERDDADRRERDVARQAAQTTDLLLVRGISASSGRVASSTSWATSTPTASTRSRERSPGSRVGRGPARAARPGQPARPLPGGDRATDPRHLAERQLDACGRSPGAFRGRAGRSGEVAAQPAAVRRPAL